MKRACTLGLATALVACGGGRTLRPVEAFVDRPIPRETSMAAGEAADEDALRGSMPARIATKPWPALRLDDERLANGARVITVPRRDFPIIACVFALDRGIADVPPAAAEIYAGAITGASQAYDRRENWEYLRFVGATAHGSTSPNGTYLQVSALSPLLGSAMSRAAPMFLAPKLAGEDVDDAREHLRARRERDVDSPTRLSGEALMAALFPPPHPYGTPSDGGAPDVIEKLHPTSIAQLRDLHLSPEHVAVVCVGDLEHDAIVRTLRPHLEKLAKKPVRPPVTLDVAGAPALSPILLVDRPGSAQTNVAMGWVAPAASHPDLAPLEVLAASAGAGLSSRLNLTVRRELGATYGVRMSVGRRRGASPIVLRAAIDTARTGEALASILRELGKLPSSPLGAEELASAKQHAVHVSAADSNAEIASEVAGAVVTGRAPADVLATSARLAAVTPAQVSAAASTYVDPTRARIVVVGDAAKIEGALRALGRPVERVR